MKPLPQEVRRLRQIALIQKKASPDTRPEVTKADLADFTKEVLATIQRTKKHVWVVCLEIEKGDD